MFLVLTRVLLKKEYLQSLLTEYWTQLLETWPDGSPEQLKRAAWSLTARQARQKHLISQAFTRGQESRERTRMMQRKKGYGK